MVYVKSKKYNPKRFVAMDGQAISIEEARGALIRSGYLIEARIAEILDKRRYYIRRNCVYPDPTTGKTRELDLSASMMLQGGLEDPNTLFVELLIECLNNPQPIAFITHTPQMPSFYENEVKVAGIPALLPDREEPESWVSLAEYFRFRSFHHYCKGRVVTQFCSFQQKKPDQQKGSGKSIEWMALHVDHHFDSIRKLADAVDHSILENFKHCVTRNPKHQALDLDLLYPVIVVQGELLEAIATRRSVTLRPATHIQFRHSEARGHREVQYQIDIVTEAFFPRYLRLVEKETSRINRLLIRHQAMVLQAVRILSQKTRKARKEESRLRLLGMG